MKAHSIALHTYWCLWMFLVTTKLNYMTNKQVTLEFGKLSAKNVNKFLKKEKINCVRRGRKETLVLKWISKIIYALVCMCKQDVQVAVASQVRSSKHRSWNIQWVKACCCRFDLPVCVFMLWGAFKVLLSFQRLATIYFLLEFISNCIEVKSVETFQ